MSTIPTISQIVKVYDKGVTMPLLCALEPNRTLAVIKYPFNPLGNHVLINEWIAHSIAKAILAPIPPFGCCLLTNSSTYGEEFQASIELENIDFDFQNHGCCFFSSWISKAIPMKPTYLSVMKNENDFDLMLLLDYIVGNVDRHSGNILFSMDDKMFYAIDYSNIFNSQRGWNVTSLKEEIAKKDYQSAHLLDRKGNWEVYGAFWNNLQLDKLYRDAQIIKAKLTYEFLKSIVDNIPSAWNEYISPEGKLLLCEYLYNRVQNIEVFCTTVEQGGR